MASQIPQTPRRPAGRSHRGSFWRGVLVTLGLIVAVYVANILRINGGDGISVNGRLTRCGEEQVTVLVDGVTHAVNPNDAEIWKITDRNIRWTCGNGAASRHMLCNEGTEYLLVVRYPAREEMFIQCTRNATDYWRDLGPPPLETSK